MRKPAFILLAAAALATSLAAEGADPRSNCLNQCAAQQVQCTRPIVARGGVNVEGCNKQFAACQAGCPAASAPPPAGGGGGGAAGSQKAASPPTPIFVGGGAPLPPPVDTASAADPVEAEEERLRLLANFEAGETQRAMNARRDEIVAMNRVLERLAQAAGQNLKIQDPDPIGPIPLAPPKGRRARGAAGSASAPTTPAWPVELQTTKDPDSCQPMPGSFGQWKTSATCGPITVQLALEQERSVLPGHEDEKLRARMSSSAKTRFGVRFKVRVTMTSGEVLELSETSQSFTHPASSEVAFRPFGPSLSCPLHVASWEVTEMFIVDWDTAHAAWLKKNPQCDPALNGGNSSCYFSPWPEYRQPCASTGRQSR